jgi:hypothetical protein
MYRAALAVFIAAMLTGVSLADLSNGSFESGLTDWTTVVAGGEASAAAVTSHADPGGNGTGTTSWSPTQGQYFALLRADSPTSTTQLSQSLTVGAGDVLSFDYFWDWTDYPDYWDPATGKIISGAGETTLFEVSGADGTDSYWGTPWTSIEHTFTSSGTYTLLFEVRNTGDTGNDPFLGVDNVKLNGVVDPVPTPIPAAMLLGMLGLGTAGFKLRRFA